MAQICLGFSLSLYKIMRDDWLLNGPIFYCIGLSGPIQFLFRICEFWRENLGAYFNEIFGELSIYVEKFWILKCAGTLVHLLLKLSLYESTVNNGQLVDT